MRLLFVNSIQMFAGAEVWFLTISRALRERGHTVELVCRPGTELERRSREAGVPVYTMRFGADVGPISVWRATRLLFRTQPDVVITNMEKELRTFGLASKLVGGSKVVHRRAIDHPLKNRLRYRVTYNCLADHVVANSRSTRNTMLTSAPWLREGHVTVIYNGIDPSPYERGKAFRLRREWGVAFAEKVIGFVGQLDERKGIDVLLQAFEFLSSRVQAKLVLVGKGQLENAVRRFQNERAAGKRVVLAGFRDDIPLVMRNFDMLVLPSYWEGFGIVLLEAMAAGLPVVATNVSSIPEIVVEGETGVLVPPGDALALSKALEEVLTDMALAERLGEAGRERVRQHFTVEKMVSAWEALLREIIMGSDRETRKFCAEV